MILRDVQARLEPLAPDVAAALQAVGDAAVLTVDPGEFTDTAALLLRVGFDRLEMVTAVDRGEHFELVYVLTSTRLSVELTITSLVDRSAPVIGSAYSLWPAAAWQEREVYDLFGVVFEGHPDLRRILLPEEFEGHPLRKDYDDPRMIRRPDYI